VLMGSALSALAGYLVLSLAPREQPHARAARSM
jgi:NhaA family Na+:H+ antiporter